MWTVDREQTEQDERQPAPSVLDAGGPVRIDNIRHGFARYKGVGLTAVVIVLVSAVLPGAAVIRSRSRLDVERPQGAVSTSGAVATPTTDTVAGRIDPLATPPAAVVLGDQPARGSAFSTDAFTSDAAHAAKPSSGSSVGASGGTVASGNENPTSAIALKTPLRVRAASWSTRTAGTPLAAQDVPEKTLPVGKRVGQDDKLSFVKLQGTDRVLRLKLGDDAGQRTPEAAIVLACPVTAAWHEAEGMSLDADPDYDCAEGVQGKAEGAVWVFDLSSFEPTTVTSDHGFALVPGGEGLADFQVAFAR